MAPVLRSSAVRGYVRRWTTLVAVAAQRSYANTLLHGDALAGSTPDGNAPTCVEVLHEARFAPGPVVSRVPARCFQ